MQSIRVFLVASALCLFARVPVFAQAFTGNPKLIVIVVIDQFRGD